MAALTASRFSLGADTKTAHLNVSRDCNALAIEDIFVILLTLLSSNIETSVFPILIFDKRTDSEGISIETSDISAS